MLHRNRGVHVDDRIALQPLPRFGLASDEHGDNRSLRKPFLRIDFRQRRPFLRIADKQYLTRLAVARGRRGSHGFPDSPDRILRDGVRLVTADASALVERLIKIHITPLSFCFWKNGCITVSLRSNGII